MCGRRSRKGSRQRVRADEIAQNPKPQNAIQSIAVDNWEMESACSSARSTPQMGVNSLRKKRVVLGDAVNVDGVGFDEDNGLYMVKGGKVLYHSSLKTGDKNDGTCPSKQDLQLDLFLRGAVSFRDKAEKIRASSTQDKDATHLNSKSKSASGLINFKKHKRSASSGLQDFDPVHEMAAMNFNRKHSVEGLMEDNKLIGFIKSHNPFKGGTSKLDARNMQQASCSDPNSPCLTKRRSNETSPLVVMRQSGKNPRGISPYHLSSSIGTCNTAGPQSAPSTPSRLLARLSGDFGNVKTQRPHSAVLDGVSIRLQQEGVWQI